MSTGLKVISEHACFGGIQGFYAHESRECDGEMRFAVYRPPHAQVGAVPVLWCLAGLTGTEENFTVKAGAQRLAAHYGLMLVMPDTSPRVRLPGDDLSFDFGIAAGFYLDATVEPWARHYRMYSYVTRELPRAIGQYFPGNMARQGICGHSMGGHGALTIALKNPQTFASVSAFAPIAAPMQGHWGQKAFNGYLGADREAWREYDASELVQRAPYPGVIRIDQGSADKWLAEDLRADVFLAACEKAGQRLEYRSREGYDHGYYFIQTFIHEHMAFHAERLTG
jgi:S-formylglutathione hydrolase